MATSRWKASEAGFDMSELLKIDIRWSVHVPNSTERVTFDSEEDAEAFCRLLDTISERPEFVGRLKYFLPYLEEVAQTEALSDYAKAAKAPPLGPSPAPRHETR